MGYCYTMGGRLVCDNCGTAGGVLKRTCPYSYCPAPALCKECHQAFKGEYKNYHEDHCKAASEKFKQKLELEKTLQNQGVPVRCAALNAGGGLVHVLFRSKAGTEGYFMAAAIYQAIPLGETATPADYKKLGQVLPAPASF